MENLKTKQDTHHTHTVLGSGQCMGEYIVSTTVEEPPSKDTGIARVLFGGTTRGPGLGGQLVFLIPRTLLDHLVLAMWLESSPAANDCTSERHHSSCCCCCSCQHCWIPSILQHRVMGTPSPPPGTAAPLPGLRQLLGPAINLPPAQGTLIYRPLFMNECPPPEIRDPPSPGMHAPRL